MVLCYESDQNYPFIGDYQNSPFIGDCQNSPFIKDYQNSPFIGSKGDSQSRRKGYCPLKGNPDRGDRPGTMGNPLAERATFILQQGTYPGDMLTRHRDPEHFCVYHTMEDRYVILDREHRLPVDLCIPGRHLRDPDFALDCWYARQLGELYGYSPRQIQDHSWAMESWYPENGRQTMGPVLADRVIEILSAYGPYLLDSDDCVLPDRFECKQTEDDTYELRDYALVYKTSVSMDQLMNPRFEVANWYARKLTCTYEALCAGLSENNPEYYILELLD